MRQLIVMALIMFTGCGGSVEDPTPHTVSIDSEFKDIINEFEHFSGIRVNITVEFTSLALPIVGLCFDSTYDHIEIDSVYWNKSDMNIKTALLWHELGHCILKRGHLNTLLPNGIPTSIMNYYVIPSIIFGANRDYYVRELVGIN